MNRIAKHLSPEPTIVRIAGCEDDQLPPIMDFGDHDSIDVNDHNAIVARVDDAWRQCGVILFFVGGVVGFMFGAVVAVCCGG